MSRRGKFRAAALAALVVATILGVPGSVSAAGAATAWVSGGTLYFQAGAGATNWVAVFAEGTAIRLGDSNDNPVTLDLGRAGGCVQRDAWTVACPSHRPVHAYLGDGDDTFNVYANVTTHVHGDGGNDILYGWFAVDVLYGGAGNDELYGLPGNDTLVGDRGNDLIRGDLGFDQILGGEDRDTLHGDGDADTIDGGDGLDVLYGGVGNDSLAGGSGYGGSGGAIYGEAGDDTLAWDNVTEDYWGGAGFDTISYAQVDRKVIVMLDDLADDYALPHPTAVANPHNAHSDLERVVGSPYNDLILGSDLPNTLLGGAGDDRIFGEGGNDIIDVQGGANQWAYGWEGQDVCTGSGLTVADSCEG